MRPFHIRALAAIAVAAFGLAACGSSNKSSSSSSPTTAAASTTAPTTTAAAAAKPVVKLAATKLGQVLVDDKGMTVYRFDNDTTPGKTTCGPGVCASTWPAVIVTGTPTAGPGIDGKLSTFMRDDGKTQLQIGGHPLYTFAGDSKPGDTNGQGILDKWYAVTADGDKAGDKS
jgi:predicted lipoprotein with Yx(FWY)xxD motif